MGPTASAWNIQTLGGPRRRVLNAVYDVMECSGRPDAEFHTLAVSKWFRSPCCPVSSTAAIKQQDLDQGQNTTSIPA